LLEASIPDLLGRLRAATMVVTGASAGIGAASAVQLTASGHRVLATGRSPAKLAGVHERMLGAAPDVDVVPDPVVADFASLDQVRELAETILARSPRLDVLANNAALHTRRRRVSADGYELTFAVNHLAPFLLTNLLLDRLASSGGRVVSTSSIAHRVGRIDFDDVQLEHGWRAYRSYGRSKLANIWFTSELRRRAAIPATCFSPGGVKTELARDSSIEWLMAHAGPVLKTPEQGAETLVWLATDAEGGSPRAVYYTSRRPGRVSAAAQDDVPASRLWDESARLVGLDP
jgi:NAD(P)-dependent dehydrogenase (short-subunit alcohol dehydrogenase family)